MKILKIQGNTVTERTAPATRDRTKLLPRAKAKMVKATLDTVGVTQRKKATR